MSKTIVFTGQIFNLNASGLPDPGQPIQYFDQKKGKWEIVKARKIRGRIVKLLDNGWAVLESHRSRASYGVFLGKVQK